MPTIIKSNYKNLFLANAEDAIKKYDIQGFVISNICNIKLLNNLFSDLNILKLLLITLSMCIILKLY